VNVIKFSYVLLIAAALALVACKQEAGKTPEAAARPAADPNLVTASPELLQRLTLAKVGEAEMREILRIPGSISVDEQRVARIGATVTGRITDIDVVLGQAVKQGQVLATLNSTELAQNQLAFIKSLQQIELQSKAVERARLLLNADVIGSAELQRREVELSTAQAELNASRDQLQVLGMSDKAIDTLARTKNIRSVSSVYAKLDGTVIERKVNLGQVVQPADELFIVADLSHVWAVAEVPERQADLIQKGQEVTIEIPALQGRQFTGRLIYVGDTVDPETRTVAVRTDLDNADRMIKPEMLSSMLVQSRPTMQLAVPVEAIVREEDQDHVFVQVAPNQFRLRQVRLGHEFDGKRAVLADLAAGDTVVTSGAFHLNSERKRKELE
jgi:cobalt-zinc-cadmium efflux system membrane fusion protein